MLLTLATQQIFAQGEPTICCGWTVVDVSGDQTIQLASDQNYLLNIEDIHPDDVLKIHGDFEVNGNSTWEGMTYHKNSIGANEDYKIPIIDENGKMIYVDLPPSIAYQLAGQLTITDDSALTTPAPLDPPNYAIVNPTDLQDHCGTFTTGNIVSWKPNLDNNHMILCNPNTRVGIGTIDPEKSLHVEDGQVLISKNTPHYSLLELKSTENNAKALKVTLDDGTNTVENLVIRNNGKLFAREVEVALGAFNWPDYVFDKNYNLPTLPELKAYIKENGHLPGLPSTKEMEEKGQVSLLEMQVKMLEKIEELTLYILELEAENKKMEQLEENYNALDERLKALETPTSKN